jgi:hypothetical protein
MWFITTGGYSEEDTENGIVKQGIGKAEGASGKSRKDKGATRDARESSVVGCG